MMKGQLFIITGLIIIVILTGLKSSLSLSKVLEQQRTLVEGLDALSFSNARSEMIRTLQISYNSTTNMTNNLINFDGFLRDTLTGQGVEFDSLLIESYYPSLAANTNTNLNVVVYNSLGTQLQFLNLTYNGASATTSVGSQGTYQTTFTINTATSTNQSLLVFYNTSTASQSENITIPLNIGNSTYISFFDLRYISFRGQQSDKFTYIVRIS